MTTQVLTAGEAWGKIQKEYPGILRMRHKFVNIRQPILTKLACYIHINLPKSYYAPEVADLDEYLQDIYYDLNGDLWGNQPLQGQENFDQARNCRNSSDDQAQAQQQLRKNKLPQKLNIAQLKELMTNFNNFSNVSPALLRSVSEFSLRRKQVAVFENFIPKQKDRNKKHPIKLSSKVIREPIPDKKEITITLGDKIPIEVREMREHVKMCSVNSFAVSSHKIESEKSEVQMEKTLISFALNKVAMENLADIFHELKPLVTKSQELCSFLSAQILQKCLSQPKMAQVYIKLGCLCTKIPISNFNWELQKIVKTNNFHRILTDQLESLFNANLKDVSKNIRHTSFAIGSLIAHRKLSRKIFQLSLNCLLEKICGSEDQIEQEFCFQALITLVDSVREIFDENWGQINLNQYISQKNMTECCNGNQRTLQELLVNLIERCKFSTSRIQCLTMNLFDKKQFQVQTTQSTGNPEVQENSQALKQLQIKQLLGQQNGLDKTIAILAEDERMLCPILMALLDGTKNEITINTRTLLNSNTINGQQFLKFWQDEYLQFVFRQCDMPFMIEGLVTIIKELDQSLQYNWIINASQSKICEEDMEDIQYFMTKLSKKLNI